MKDSRLTFIASTSITLAVIALGLFFFSDFQGRRIAGERDEVKPAPIQIGEVSIIPTNAELLQPASSPNPDNQALDARGLDNQVVVGQTSSDQNLNVLLWANVIFSAVAAISAIAALLTVSKQN